MASKWLLLTTQLLPTFSVSKCIQMQKDRTTSIITAVSTLCLLPRKKWKEGNNKTRLR